MQRSDGSDSACASLGAEQSGGCEPWGHPPLLLHPPLRASTALARFNRPCARRASGCRRSPAAAATRAAGGRPPAGRGSPERRTGATPTALGRLGARLERAVGPAEPVRQQLLPAHAHPLQPGAVGELAQLDGHEGVHVDERSPTPSSDMPPAVARRPAGAAQRRRHSGATAPAGAWARARGDPPQRDGSPANSSVPPGASTRASSPKARPRSGMWCRTA